MQLNDALIESYASLETKTAARCGPPQGIANASLQVDLNISFG